MFLLDADKGEHASAERSETGNSPILATESDRLLQPDQVSETAAAAPGGASQPSGMDALIDTFQARRARALGPHDGTADRRHREMGKADARQRIDALLDKGTFERMRQRSDDLAPDVPLGIINDSREFFRSGSSGQWRQWLTDEDLARYEERIAALAPAGLVDWLHHGSHT